MALTDRAALEHAAVVRPCLGEVVSGDTTVVRPIEGGLLVAIVDVLGHGPDAHALTLEIEAYLGRLAGARVAALMDGLHQHLRGSRGAAVGLCAVDLASGRLEYVGIGNTTLRRFGSPDLRLVSQDGVVGQNIRTPRVQTLQLGAGDLLVLHTDGVRERFSSDDVLDVAQQPPKEVAGAIVARFGKDYDDAACIALRYRP